jgi:hypothetical protein
MELLLATIATIGYPAVEVSKATAPDDTVNRNKIYICPMGAKKELNGHLRSIKFKILLEFFYFFHGRRNFGWPG